MAKSLYSALFDWIVFRINHALLNIKDLMETTKVGQYILYCTVAAFTTNLLLNILLSCFLKKKTKTCPSDPVHWSARHLRLRGLREQQFRAVLHQLCQRASPALLQPAHLQAWTSEKHFHLDLSLHCTGVDAPWNRSGPDFLISHALILPRVLLTAQWGGIKTRQTCHQQAVFKGLLKEEQSTKGFSLLLTSLVSQQGQRCVSSVNVVLFLFTPIPNIFYRPPLRWTC